RNCAIPEINLDGFESTEAIILVALERSRWDAAFGIDTGQLEYPLNTYGTIRVNYGNQNHVGNANVPEYLSTVIYYKILLNVGWKPSSHVG
ncbi:hypothetical protein AVEN_159644-1, partial [Araneus ventricosus]